MVTYLNPPLTARNGHTLKVILPSRVSSPGPGKQNKEQSLGDQQDIQHRWLQQHTDLPLDITVVAGIGSGEILEREEYLRLLELIESEEYDLVLPEDLSRIVRRVHAFFVCELCEDHNVRLIAINNHNVDTAQPGWRDAAFFASYFYEKENRDKSVRLKERLRSRFLAGGALPRRIYGYIMPPGAKVDADLKKDPEAEPIYEEWFRRLDERWLYTEVADWLNENSVATGPYCRKTKWDGKLVSQTTHNWLLKGVRFRNKQKTKRNNETGKYLSEKAKPEDLLERRVPHLAFFEEAYYDRVVTKADERNAKYCRTKNGVDPRKNVPKKRTRFPGQSVDCGVCGRLYVFGGHGQKEHLMCSGAREHKCWNGITFDGPLAANRISAAVFAAIESLPDFDPAFLELVNEEANRFDTVRERQRCDLVRLAHRQERERDNLMNFIRGGDTSAWVREDLTRLERDHPQTLAKIQQLDQKPTNAVVVPPIEDVKEVAREAFRDLDIISFEFGKLMRRIIPKIVVFPYRLCDGGHLMLRARFRLSLARLIPDTRLQEVLERPLQRVLTVDLFDPPQREEFRERVVVKRKDGKRERDVAEELGITVTATQRAAALQRMMDTLGITDPYVQVMEPPDDYRKLRRHRHPRYKFEPLDGAGEI